MRKMKLVFFCIYAISWLFLGVIYFRLKFKEANAGEQSKIFYNPVLIIPLPDLNRLPATFAGRTPVSIPQGGI